MEATLPRRVLTLLALVLLAPAAARAADAPAKPLPPAVETDARLHADGKGWRLDRARIVDAKRPRVLLIGDSILNGYVKQVTAALEGRAYVDAWVNPYNQSEHLNKLLGEVLENGPYDVVHFNMGLHGWQEGRIKPGTFEPLTKAYVEVIRAKLPKARIVWASSTPVTVKDKPADLDPEVNPIIVEHNRMAAKVMAEMNVPVNDFYGLLVDKRNLARGDRFHWTGPAYQILADAVVESVRPGLPDASVPIFDGKTFDGWEGDTTNTWRVEDGALAAGSLQKKQAKNDFLATRKQYANFDLTLRWKLEGTEGFVNGGVQFRSQRIPNDHEVSGYQADLGMNYDGALYDESRRKKMLAVPAKEVLEKARKPLGEWNDYRIRAEGRRIRIWLNGIQTVDYTEPDPAIPQVGIIAVQIHGNATSVVRYKDLRIEELPATPSTAPATRPAAAPDAVVK
ncbi:MAG TPA: family 16 glycoside hydrolase [Humisphaera sp.]